jgi:hypothetical protein
MVERRGRGRHPKPSLTFEQILAWADAHFARTGACRRSDSGRSWTAHQGRTGG